MAETAKTETPAPAATRRKSFSELIAEVEGICGVIDETGVVPLEVVQALDDATMAIAERTDQWIERREAADAYVAVQKARVARAEAELARAQATYDRIDLFMLHLVERNTGLVFKGERGRLASQKNSTPSLTLNLTTAKKSISTTIEKDQLAPGIDEFVEERTVYVVKSKEITDAIKAGRVFSWAQSVTGTHLRVR